MMDTPFPQYVADVQSETVFGMTVFVDALITVGQSLNTSPFDIDSYVRMELGSRTRKFSDSLALSVVYGTIFVTGLIGNACTCVVIARHSHMHTATNYYLCSLALSDVLTLIIGLPPEVYAIWEAYPWRFGEPYCLLKTFMTEMTSSASILTIVAFTIERYVAICHPLRAHSYTRPSRAIKTVLVVWAAAIVSALPYPIHTRIYPYLTHPGTGEPLTESIICNILTTSMATMRLVFQASTLILFVVPIGLISVLYVLIGLRLRDTSGGQCQLGLANHLSQSRRNVIRMLVAVVVAFVVCWAPFHAQRLLTVYVADDQWTPGLLQLETQLFYISGILYFVSATVNPILYNVMSRRYRQAFSNSLWCCGASFCQWQRTPSVSRLSERISVVLKQSSPVVSIARSMRQFDSVIELTTRVRDSNSHVTVLSSGEHN